MITIVIPIHNREKFLRRTLDSIAASTFRPINLILVDNGSSDGSMAIAEQFQRQQMADNFSIYITEELQQGASFARNKGLSRVKTKYVYFFDDDDLFDKDFLSTFEPLLAQFSTPGSQLSALSSQQVPDMICLTTTMQTSPDFAPVVRDYHFTGSDPVCNQILSGPLSTPSVIWRTEWLREIGGWNKKVKVWQDWELGVRALLHGPKLMWYKDHAFHTVFVHANSITGSSTKDDRLNTIETVRALLTDRRHIKALWLRRLNLNHHIPGLWRIAKLFRNKE